jgi:hypothetical protein
VTLDGIKYDNNKTRYDLLEPFFEELVAQVLTQGAKKYSPDNWKSVQPLEDRYYAALRRHVTSWRNGEIFDPESGFPHLAHAACNIYFLMWNDIQQETNVECDWEAEGEE